MAAESHEDVLAEGLMRFYSSQAEVMLAQYRNINDLLGPTTHHTHPGTHCELLLRACIRQILPPNWSADKGFIFGRPTRDGKDVHSPEIDILIHDTSIERPVFQLDDFVIVHPSSVVGLIQVKKSLQGRQLNAAIQNVVVGKQHFFDMWRKANGNKLIFPMNIRRPFSAVVGFEGDLSEVSLKNSLTDCVKRHRGYEMPGDGSLKTSIFVLPEFIGSLQGQVAIGGHITVRRSYDGYDSQQDGLNIAVQMLLWHFSAVARRELPTAQTALPTHPGRPQPRFSFTVGGESPQ